MLHRTILLVALLIAPLALSPAPLSAQDRGLNTAAVATDHAEDVAGWTKASASKRPPSLPEAIASRFGDLLPPGLGWTRGEDGGSPPDSGEPPPPAEECEEELVFVEGVLMIRDCEGNLTPVFGTP